MGAVPIDLTVRTRSLNGRAMSDHSSASAPAGPPPRNRPKRQRVIDAAAAVFAQSGYHGVGTRAIADKIGIKVASLYFHIPSKEQALEEVCVVGIQRPLDFLNATLAEADGLAERIRLFFRYQHEELLAHSDYIGVYLHERRHLPAEGGARVARLSRAFRLELDRMFVEAAARGELHPSLTPRLASLHMIGAIRNVTQLYTEGPIRDFDAFLAQSTEALIRAVSAPPGKPARRPARSRG